MKAIFVATELIQERPEPTKVMMIEYIDSKGPLSHIIIWRNEWETQGGE